MYQLSANPEALLKYSPLLEEQLRLSFDWLEQRASLGNWQVPELSLAFTTCLV